MLPANIPDYAETVLVPIANPLTAEALIRLGGVLTDPDDGRLLVEFVSTGNSEQETDTIHAIQPIVESLQAEGLPIEFITRVSTTAARGILDAVRELDVDLLILGVHQVDSTPTLGPVIENIAGVAPCDMLIYRSRSQPRPPKRVVIPTDGSVRSQVACRVGLLIAAHDDADIEAVHVQSRATRRWESEARIERSLANLPGRERVRRRVIMARRPVPGLLTGIGPDDLIILGLSEQSQLERTVFGDFSREVLEQAPCPVILTIRSTDRPTLTRRLQRILSRVSIVLTRIEQDEIVWLSEDYASPNLDYFVQIVIAATLAALGLLINSTAVIIGAMLVAPLMQPCIAFAVGMATGRAHLVGRALLTLALGVGVSVLFALSLGYFFPAPPTPEILARGNPTLLDALIALASGVIGAYATARKDIPAALAGVAIAAALMPPLCVVGLLLAGSYRAISLGAALLFSTNIACIILAAWLTFLWMGMRPHLEKAPRHARYVLAAFITLFVLPVLAALTIFTNGASQESLIRQSLTRAFEEHALADVTIVYDDPLRVTATLYVTEPLSVQDVAEAEERIEDRLARPVELEVIMLPVLR